MTSTKTDPSTPAAVFPYGQWPSPLNTVDVFSRPGVPQFPERVGEDFYWLQSLPEEKGRTVLVRRAGGADDDRETTQLTPSGFSIRTRVHEYGGRCHVLDDESCWFVNFDDQRLYRQALDGASPVSVLGNDAGESPWMFADLVLHPNGGWLFAVGERAVAGRENENTIVAINVGAMTRDGVSAAARPDRANDTSVTVVAAGSDFYASPRISPDGTRIAWVRWEHPHMPWDQSELVVCDFDSVTGACVNEHVVAGGDGVSVCQPFFNADGALGFAADGAGEGVGADFWNLYCRKAGGAKIALTEDRAEYGEAHWVFGYSRVTPLGNGGQLAIASAVDGDRLMLIGPDGATPLTEPASWVSFSQLSAESNGMVYLIGYSATRDASVLGVDVERREVSVLLAGGDTLASQDVSVGVPVEAPTRDGDVTHSLAYPPTNSGYRGPTDARPPLMVLVHGGPTSRSGLAFDPLRQFWTTRGFAVLDVNHRGSTGHGRSYRQALHGLWGERDVDDVVDAVTHYTQQGHADPERVFIRGGSAGGFAVLAALTRYPEVFCAGACYYGIGNLETLAKSTHKFESRYLDSLLGEPWDDAMAGKTDTVYYTRSPIHRMHAVRSPMILFQGTEDRVVPPEVSREVVDVLKAAGLKHEYIEFEGEGHGFRSAPNRVRALEAEAAFFAELMDHDS